MVDTRLDGDDLSLAALLKAARNRRGWSQEYAATKFGKSKQRLSQFENGRARPQLDEVVQLHAAMFGSEGGGGARAASLARWIAAWIGDHQRSRAPYMRAALQADYDGAMALLDRAIPKPRTGTAGSGRSLAGFPDSFLPLQIIVGDRREASTNRLSRGDFFALDVASSDLMFLGDLLLEYPAFLHDRPPMWSDKVVVLLDQETLQRRLGCSNLLIIGSPAVNLAARRANPNAVFRFDVDSRWVEWDELFRAHLKLGDKEICRQFAQILTVTEESAGKASLKEIKTAVKAMDAQAGVKPKNERDFDAALEIARKVLGEPGDMTVPKHVIYEFRRSGFVDPADRLVHGGYTTQTTDFGVVSLAPNPFADPDSGHVSILAGGIHGPGTAHAVKFLASPDNFAEHPFGGVIEVELGGEEAAWPDRFRNAGPKWQTAAYDAERLLSNLDSGAQPANPNAAAWRGRYEAHELDRLREFVTRLSGAAVGR